MTSDDPRPDPSSSPESVREDALAQNLSRVPLPARTADTGRDSANDAAPGAERAPSDALRTRIEDLAREVIPGLTKAPQSGAGSPLGEGRDPSAACYNDPTSEGGADPSDLESSESAGVQDRGSPHMNTRAAGAPQRRARPAREEGDPMNLQACTKCGAQFDVSSFSSGQQFTCGACGTVLTAGGAKPAGAPKASAPRSPKGRAPAKRTPGGRSPSGKSSSARAPARRTPGGPKKAVAGGPGAPSRGPQYQPVQRTPGAGGAAPKAGSPKAGSPKAGASSRGKPARARSGRGSGRGDAGEEGGRRAGGSRQSSTGPNKGLLIGVGVVVVAVVVGLVAMGGGKKDQGSNGAESAGAGTGGGTKTPAIVEPTETAREIMGEYATDRPTMHARYKGYIRRLQALDTPQAKNGLRSVYEDFIKGPGLNDKAARAFLGYKEFSHEIPEGISFRKYPYLAAVKAAYNRHWFASDEKADYETAMKAWKKTEEHAERLLSDHRFAAADRMRGNISRDKFFKDYNYAARWSDPHLICYSSKDRISEYDLLLIEDKAERDAQRAEVMKKQAKFERVLDEKQAIFSQLYKEFMTRYKEPLGLKPLMAEWGGRPDYPGNVRSYRDGAPLVVWIFDNRESFDEYHSKVKEERFPGNVAGYFSPTTTYVYLYDEGESASNRVFEINKNVHEGTHQLEFWFTRQRNNWRKPKPGQDFFGEGIAEYIGAVQMQPDRTLKFIGVNVPRLKNMQQQAKAQDKAGGKYNLFPVEKLVGFTSYNAVQNWGSGTWGLPRGMVLGMFYQQSWAFVYFLNEYEGGRYKKQFLQYFNLVLHRETGGAEGDKAFREAFRIRDEDDWEEMNDEFHEYITDVLMKMDTKEFDYTPPPRGETK